MTPELAMVVGLEVTVPPCGKGDASGWDWRLPRGPAPGAEPLRSFVDQQPALGQTELVKLSFWFLTAVARS